MKETGLELKIAFDRLAPFCEVGEPLCQVAATGALDVPLDLEAICTRVGLPRTRAGDVERALLAGQSVGVFFKVTELTWQAQNKLLAGKLAPLLLGAYLYRSRVHRDKDLVDVVLTKPRAPSKMAEKLENMLKGDWGLRDTRQLLPSMAESAHKSFIIMTPYLDEVGADIVINLFEQAKVLDKCLIVRATTEGSPPPGLAGIYADLVRLMVDVVNFRLDRTGAAGKETFHSKLVLADDVSAYIGSSNMHKWSFDYSLEIGLHVEGQAAKRIADIVHAARSVSISMMNNPGQI
jgi:hypothetical protein